MKILMMGPPPEVVGGMSTVAATLESHFRGDDRFAVEWVDSGGGRGARGYQRFPTALARVAVGRFDVLHLHVASGGSTLRKAFLAAAVRARSIPYVVHLHGANYVTFLRGLSRRRHRFVRALFLGAAGVIVLGESWRRVLVDGLALPADRITVVNNGVDPLVWISDAAKRTPRRVVFVGEVTCRKGADLLAQAWSVLVADGTAEGWTCVCLGPTPDASVVEAAAQMPAQAQATFELRGPVTGQPKNDVISGSSIFCLPSRAEGLPMALLEAMSAGLPAVTTDVGAIGEVVNESNGRLLPPDDLPALTAALAALMNDDGLRSALSDGAFATWRGRFTATLMAESVAGVWRTSRNGRHELG